MPVCTCVFGWISYQTLTDNYFIHVCIIVTHGMCAHRFAFACISLRLRNSRIISDLDDDTITCLRLCESETKSWFYADTSSIRAESSH